MMQKRSIKDARGDFPMMDRQVHGDKRLVYLDNASTTQKPLQVIDTLTKYYKNYNANIHRAVYYLRTEDLNHGMLHLDFQFFQSLVDCENSL